MELGVSEDTSSGVPSVMATTLHTLLGPTAGAGRLFLHSLERALDTSQQWLNHYLPPGERQEGKRPPGHCWGSPRPRMLLGIPMSPSPWNAAEGPHIPFTLGCYWASPRPPLPQDAAGGPPHPPRPGMLLRFPMSPLMRDAVGCPHVPFTPGCC